MTKKSTSTLLHPTTGDRMRALLAVFLVFALFAFAAGVISIAYLAVQTNERQDQNQELLREVKSTNKRLIDCTTPGGECYAEGQKNTGKAIMGINEGTMRVIVAALSCQADGITEEQELAVCTVERSRHP